MQPNAVSDQFAARATLAVVERSLTPREAECVSLLHLGNADIGMALGISPRTVSTLLSRAYVKLGVETRTAAALAILRRAPVSEPRDFARARRTA